MAVAKSNKEQFLATEEPAEEDVIVSKEVRVIAEELRIVNALASNDVNLRNKHVKKLRSWLPIRARSSVPLGEDNFVRLWKGLYYTMWMSDKPLVQEDLAEKLAQLLECFDEVQLSLEFFGAFLHTMCSHWLSLDQWRKDKFQMLVRRMLRYMFRVLKAEDWNADKIKQFNKKTFGTVLDQDTSIGLIMHYMDIFYEELAKVSEGNITAAKVGIFLQPFVEFMANTRDGQLVAHCRKQIFYHLLFQSDLGREYDEKYQAWRRMGFPTKSINELEKVADDNDNASSNEAEVENGLPNAQKDKVLDPRAGDVDVLMPTLPLDGAVVIKRFEKVLQKELPTKRRKILRRLLLQFETYQKRVFPLGIKTMPRFEQKSKKPLIREKVQQLEQMEQNMFSAGRALKQLNKKKRRKILKSINYDNLTEDNFEEAIKKAIKSGQSKSKTATSELSKDAEEEEPPKKLQRLNGGKLEKKNGKKLKPSKGAKSIESQVTKKTIKLENQQPKVLKANLVAAKKPKDAASKKISNGVVAAKETDTKAVENKDEPLTYSVLIKKPKVATKHASTQETTTNANTIAMEALKPSSLKKAAATTTPTKSPTVKLHTPNDATPSSSKNASEWQNPLVAGEYEYFVQSRKKLQALVKKSQNAPEKKAKKETATTVNSSGIVKAKHKLSKKRVTIALKRNTAHPLQDYRKKIITSPMLPYDANKKPGKSLLKPNSMPGPIYPFGKKNRDIKKLLSKGI